MVHATATRSPIPARHPLTLDVAAAIAERWSHGGYADLADAAIDVVVDHLARLGVDGADERLRAVIADALAFHAAPPKRVDAPPRAAEPAQLSLFDRAEGGEVEPSPEDTIIARWSHDRTRIEHVALLHAPRAGGSR